MHFSLKLARLRSGKGISQEKMAAELGVSRQAVQKWESGAGAVIQFVLFLVSFSCLVMQANNPFIYINF